MSLLALLLLPAAAALRLAPAAQLRTPARAVVHHLVMQEPPPPPAEPAPDGAVDKPVGMQGSFYDDEVDPTPKKPALSNEMRQRLLREQQSLGADANTKNPFLFVFAGVGAFVLLGALAINM